MRKLGEALKAVVADGYESEDEEVARESVLMNANRRRAFEYVAWHPCSTASEVARELKASDPTAAWHLRKLALAEYVQTTRHGRSTLYHVTGLGLQEEEVATLAAISEPDAGRILSLLVESPGLTASELAEETGRSTVRHPIRSLLDAGLLVSVTDGRFRRYYPGKGLLELEKAAPKRLRDFRRRLVRRLTRDRLAPEARTAPGDVLEVEVRFGSEHATMRFPMGSLLSGRLT